MPSEGSQNSEGARIPVLGYHGQLRRRHFQVSPGRPTRPGDFGEIIQIEAMALLIHGSRQFDLYAIIDIFLGQLFDPLSIHLGRQNLLGLSGHFDDQVRFPPVPRLKMEMVQQMVPGVHVRWLALSLVEPFWGRYRGRLGLRGHLPRGAFGILTVCLGHLCIKAKLAGDRLTSILKNIGGQGARRQPWSLLDRRCRRCGYLLERNLVQRFNADGKGSFRNGGIQGFQHGKVDSSRSRRNGRGNHGQPNQKFDREAAA